MDTVKIGIREFREKLADYLAGRYGDGVRRGTFTLHSNRDLGAKIAIAAQNAEKAKGAIAEIEKLGSEIGRAHV